LSGRHVKRKDMPGNTKSNQRKRALVIKRHMIRWGATTSNNARVARALRSQTITVSQDEEKESRLKIGTRQQILCHRKRAGKKVLWAALNVDLPPRTSLQSLAHGQSTVPLQERSPKTSLSKAMILLLSTSSAKDRAIRSGNGDSGKKEAYRHSPCWYNRVNDKIHGNTEPKETFW